MILCVSLFSPCLPTDVHHHNYGLSYAFVTDQVLPSVQC